MLQIQQEQKQHSTFNILMINWDLWGDFIPSLRPVLAHRAVPLCLHAIVTPALALISAFVTWPGRNLLFGQVSPQCSVNGRSSLQEMSGIVNVSTGECRNLETEYSWSYLLTHSPGRLGLCLQTGWTGELRVKQACAPGCLFGAAQLPCASGGLCLWERQENV